MRSRTDVCLMALALSAALCGCDRTLRAPERLVEGDAPAVSRDGRRLAFQSARGGQMRLGLLDLASRHVTWLVDGETENACHPAWGRDGSLVYAYANITNTAYQRFCVKGGPQDGYGLALWKDGATRELTHGLWRDYMPSFSPDGSRIYFCTQRGAEKATETTGVRQRVDVLDLDVPSEPKPCILPPQGDSAVGQPVVSPDGRLIAWAELGCPGDIWHIKAARVGETDRAVQVTPVRMSAYAPNWLPDSRHLVCAGFLKGDPTWCVYAVNVVDGSVRRIAEGTDPCVSADGRTLYHVQDGWIWRRPFDPAMLPSGGGAESDPDGEPERILQSFDAVAANGVRPMPAGDFGRDRTVFCRLTVDFDGTDGFYPVFFGGYRTTSLGLMLFFKGGCAYFATRDFADTAFAVNDSSRLSKGLHRLTGIRGSDGKVYLSVDGKPAVSLGCSRGVIALDGPRKGVFFPDGVKVHGKGISDFQIGTGWPANVPKPLKGRDLVR